MSNLLRADFFRLWRSVPFWVCMVFQVGAGIFFPAVTYFKGIAFGYHISPDWNFFSGLAFLCVLSALFSSLFLGAEYSDGTVRNKLVVGHRRRDIYLSHLITCVTASLLMSSAYLLPYLALSLPLQGPFQAAVDTMLMFVLVAFLLTVALTSIYTTISMLVHQKAVATAVCIVASFLLLFVGSYLQSTLSHPETYLWQHYAPGTSPSP